MTRQSWFDSESSELLFGKYVERMESWQNALADGAVQPEEVRQQADRVTDMLRALEPKLSNELHEELTRVFYELSVLYGMQALIETTLREKGEQD